MEKYIFIQIPPAGGIFAGVKNFILLFPQYMWVKNPLKQGSVKRTIKEVEEAYRDPYWP